MPTKPLKMIALKSGVQANRMSDYSFMRTGLDTGGIQQDPTWSAEDWRLVKSALLVFVEDAMVLAARYAHIKDQPSVCTRDIIACLKVQAQRGMQGLQQAHNADQRLEIYQQLLQEEDEEEEEEEEEDDTDEEEEEDEAAGAHALDVLTDEQFSQIIDLAERNWQVWHPTERIQIILKQAVEQTERHFGG